MAKCRECGTEIPDGAEYCEVCMSKLNTAKDSESYLDSLLSAVMSEEPERRENVFPKKEASSLVSVPKSKEATKAEATFEQPLSEKPDFSLPETELLEEEGDEEELPMEEAFGSFFVPDVEELPDLKKYNIFDEMDEATVNRMLDEELQEEEGWKPEEEEREPFVEEEVKPIVEPEEFADLFSGEEESEPFVEEEAKPAVEPEEFADLFSGEEESEPFVEEEAEPAVELEEFADLFSGEEESEPFVEEKTEPAVELEEFADLFSGGEESASVELPKSGEEHTEEGVTGVENVLDPAFAELLTGFGEEDGGLFEFGAEPVELDASSELVAEVAALSQTTPVEEKNAGSKKEKTRQNKLSVLYHKLFDNVKVDPSKIKPQPTKEELEAKKKAKQEEKERTKEEKEAALAEKKEQEKQVKLEKQRIKKEAQAEKKAKKLEEAKLMLEEMQGTRINPAGASIVFAFFAMIGLGVILGTGIFSYSNSIKNAEYEFNRDEYTLAYNEIYGLEIKNEDMLLYDRVMTVMYVQKQLNSYYNYYGMKDYPRALDSLLKGLQRYEKYIALAVELDIDSDLDSVRKKILTEIQTSFFLTEQEAMEIIQVESRVEYSEKVYDTIDRLELEK